MNLAILVPELGGGGAEHMAKLLGDYYVSQGHQVYYFLGDFGVKQVWNVSGTIVNTHVTSLMSYRKRPWLWWIKLMIHARMIKRLKKKYHIDCSVSYMEEFNYLNVLSRYKDRVILRVCTILSERSDFHSLFYTPKYLHKVYTKADVVTVLTHDGSDELHRIYGIPKHKIVTVPHPVPRGEEKTTIAKETWNYGEHVIVTAGRLESVKQQDRLIRAFREVVKKVSDATLIILGTGTLEKKLKDMCQKSLLKEHVVFTGFRTDVLWFMSHASVFVLTSKCEGFSLVLVESMAQGVPVVASESPGGAREILGLYEKTFDDFQLPDAMLAMGIRALPYGLMTPRLSSLSNSDDSIHKEEVALAEALVYMLTDREVHRWYAKQSKFRSKAFCMEQIMPQWDRLLME